MCRFGIIGHPVAGSLSPVLFNKAYGGRFAYDLIDEVRFEDAWRRFLDGDYRAVNVTMPFKMQAAEAADFRSPEVEAIGAANILVKTDRGVQAHNSDYLGLCSLLPAGGGRSAAVIGSGGAGRAAEAAARHLGYDTRIFHHDEIALGVQADLIIYTLPCTVDGIGRLECDILVEANYKTPCLEGHKGYVSGRDWLLAQARTGYPLMTGIPAAEGF